MIQATIKINAIFAKLSPTLMLLASDQMGYFLPLSTPLYHTSTPVQSICHKMYKGCDFKCILYSLPIQRHIVRYTDTQPCITVDSDIVHMPTKLQLCNHIQCKATLTLRNSTDYPLSGLKYIPNSYHFCSIKHTFQHVSK